MKLRTLQTLRLGPGAILTLTPRQAARRGHALEALGGDRYRASAIIEFKAGEDVGVEGDLPKAQADLVATGAAPKAPRRKPGSVEAGPVSVDPAALVIE